MSVFQNKNDLLFNVNNPHNLIPKNKDITPHLNTNHISINSTNRDTKYYPDANYFSIRLPRPLSNVKRMSLQEIYFTGPIYNFSKNLGNNSFSISKYLSIDIDSLKKDIKLEDGKYQIKDILLYINKKLESNNHTKSIVLDYLKIQNRFIFYNIDTESFYIENNKTVCNNNDSKNPENNSSNLLFALGFDTNPNYNRIDSITKCHDTFLDEVILFPDNKDSSLELTESEDLCKNINYIIAKNSPRFRSEESIYIELERFNINFSETGDNRGLTSIYQSGNVGDSISAFAKIPAIDYNRDNNTELTRGRFLPLIDDSSKTFQQPINNISNLKFKFRYGDGMLVDLQNTSIDITLLVEQLEERII